MRLRELDLKWELIKLKNYSILISFDDKYKSYKYFRESNFGDIKITGELLIKWMISMLDLSKTEIRKIKILILLEDE